MNEPHDPNLTEDVASAPADSLDAGLAAGFGHATPPRSSLGALRPVLLCEAEGESAHVVKPKSDAMPPPELAGDRYQLSGEIARGGMGIVYRATDTVLDREVAVKVLHDKYPAGSAVDRRFTDEARIAAQLQHPGIPAVHDLGALPDGRPFLAMKLIKGHTLTELLRQRSGPAHDRGRFVAAFEQVCQAIAYAHAHKVIHRDLKPCNVMVGAFGEVQVMDWGLAKVLADGGSEGPDAGAVETEAETAVRSRRASGGTFTQAGSVLGTAAFMAPEQAAGAVGKIDKRSDVFGLGGILAVILTGRPPFAGSSPETARVQAAQGDVAECFSRLDGCGAEPELVALCKRCLAPKPQDRPAHAGEVAATVAALRAAADERARQAELDRAKGELRVAEQKRRARLWIALLGAVGLLVLSGVGFAWYSDRQTAAARDRRGRNVEAAVALLNQAEEALGEEFPPAGAVDTPLDQARLRLTDDGPPELRDRFDRLTRDREMSRRLDAVDRRLWQPGLDRKGLDEAGAAAAFGEAFLWYGLDPAGRRDQEQARQVRASSIAVRLTAALHEWLLVGGPAELDGLLNALDPDPERSALRTAYAEKDTPAVAERVARLKGQTLPAGFAVFVGGQRLTSDESAATLLRNAQAANPSHFALAMRAGMRLQFARPSEAVPYFRVAVALRPDNPVTHYNLAYAHFNLKEYRAALASFRAAARLDKADSEYRNAVGRALLALNDPDGAADEWREALSIDPGNPFVRHNLGMEFLRRKDYDAAIAQGREAVRLDPTYVNGYNLLGRAHSAKKDWAGAVDAYRRGLAHEAKPATQSYLHNNLGNALYQANDLDGAEQEYRAALQANPKNPEPHSGLADVMVKRGDLDAAAGELRKAVRLDPADDYFQKQLEDVLKKAGRIAPPPRKTTP